VLFLVAAGLTILPPRDARPALLTGPRPAHAEAVQPGLSVRLGFDGVVKVGVPIPLEVEVPAVPSGGASSEHLAAELLVEAPGLGPQAGTVVATTVVRFDAMPGAPRVFHVPVVLSDVRRPLVVRVLIAGREVLRRPVEVDPARVGGRVVVTLSREPMDLAFLHRLPGRVVVSTVGPEMLPHLWQEYTAVDLLAVRDLDEARVDDAQREALLTWIRLGGRLLLIARPGAPAPGFLDPVLPAVIQKTRSVPTLAGLTSRYGAGLPPGPYPVATLLLRPGAEVVRSAGVPLIAAAPAGRGRVTVWAFDPAAPPFPAWPGYLTLWANVLGLPPTPLVDVAAAAGHLPQSTPLDPIVHAEAGIVILLYIAAVFATGRRYPSILGVAASLMIVFGGIGVFAALAAHVRARATTLTQVTFVEEATGMGVARATVVAAVAVPYGGPFRVRAPRDAIAAPVATAGDLRIERATGGTVLSGRLRLGERARTLYAVGVVPFSVSGSLGADSQTLTVDLGPHRLRHAELRWRGLIYPLGELPPGASAHRLLPDRWSRPPNLDADDRARAWIFRGEGGAAIAAIMDATAPVLVGESSSAAPAFSRVGSVAQALSTEQGVRPAGPGQQLTILLVPLSPQPIANTRDLLAAPEKRR